MITIINIFPAILFDSENYDHSTLSTSHDLIDIEMKRVENRKDSLRIVCRSSVNCKEVGMHKKILRIVLFITSASGSM